ncbi:hypothetical protein Q8791_17810 [Nocardiopsis sp. CT-R113]|uniref:DUF6879 domain-containing protein n=1 Tax=Nocardiopsis codii TaxID=3065942 RepID=A0ABU7KBW2_9ACTN|nr:DUF6879 family protein [Nocardiopsis sp. CT-R113]MEE2039072.1 hypothetical protein [Nocardiopsis sp. CT-R113]
MFTEAELEGFFDTHLTESAFRLETLDHYDVASDGGDFQRFVAGEPEPDWERKNPWLETLRAAKEAGVREYRVRVLRTPLSDYLRYSCEWGYALNGEAGEEIHVLDLAERKLPAEVVDHDFWLLDDKYPLRMHYSPKGEFIGGELVDSLELYQKARDAALASAEPFAPWWARHPEEWRANRTV